MALHGISTKKPHVKSNVANLRTWPRSKDKTPESTRADRMYGVKGK
jgi:hypothetical protein